MTTHSESVLSFDLGSGKDASEPQEEYQEHTTALSPEALSDLVQAFCRDTRTDAASSSAEKFKHALITNAAQSHIKLRQRRLGMHCGVCLSKILKNHMLTTLDLYGNVLRDVGAIALLQLLRAHATLAHLTLGSNDLGPESGVAFARELATNRVLLSLDLGTDASALYPNRFNSLVGVAFGQALTQNGTLKRLGLSGVGIGKLQDKGADAQSLAAAAFGHMLRQNRALESLCVSNNTLGTNGCVLLLEGLAKNRALRELDVSNNGAGPEVGVVAGQCLAAKDSGIEVLDMSHNAIGPNGVSSMVSSLVANTRLRSIDISYTDMQDRGCIALANALEGNRSVEHCNCAHNGISEYGGLAWADTLWSNQKLQSLSLSNNALGDEVGVNLAGVLSQNRTLTALDLCSAKIGDEGALSMIDALEGNTALTKLKLTDNLISETGGMLLADMLEKNGNIHHLDISSNQVSHTSLLRIRNECKRKKAASASHEPRALQAQIRVLRKKEQKILETEFRIARTVSAREEAQKQAAQEKAALQAAQAESRMTCSSAQREVDQCLEQVDIIEKKLADKQEEYKEFVETSKATEERLEAALTKQALEKEELTALIEAANKELMSVRAAKGLKIDKMNGQLGQQRAQIDILKDEMEEVQNILKELEQERSKLIKAEADRKAAEEAEAARQLAEEEALHAAMKNKGKVKKKK
eukprot:CAMPEP_0206228260 /NCGR_PEP_ID=MMETSP0047_2-20121206/9076_1 /ASSEMBLY_ACC=CAM_ASM_000192 /TAXON_ID=195065 /ORGANISM="Chroomonas mesostigmatica_cf, Strain CCMP1168" /LENGTH=697 /DNA_ID=CAMNT_0053651495 /DNA_START=45 /DNA_END=2138 /DNA_ORIENTATION=-